MADDKCMSLKKWDELCETRKQIVILNLGKERVDAIVQNPTFKLHTYFDYTGNAHYFEPSSTIKKRFGKTIQESKGLN